MKLNLLIYLFVAIGSSLSLGATFSISGNSEFVAVGNPSSLKIHGQGENGLTGNLKEVNDTIEGDIKFNMDSLTTGVELRDHHMKEKYLETKTFPNASLVINKLKLPPNLQIDGFKSQNQSFVGQLTLHGITHPITGIIDLSTSSGITKGDGEFELKLSDYKIDVPSYLGITVADRVSVKVHLQAKKASGSI
jgi:hypothetical protein